LNHQRSRINGYNIEKQGLAQRRNTRIRDKKLNKMERRALTMVVATVWVIRVGTGSSR